MSPSCTKPGHKWNPWKFTFELGDGSYSWQRSCCTCHLGQVSFEEPEELKCER